MKFMMLMIPAVYQGGNVAPGFTPDPKKVEVMERGMANAMRIAAKMPRGMMQLN